MMDRALVVGVAMLALLIDAPAPAADRQPFLNLDAVIPAGVACSGFDLGITFDAQKQTVTTFFDNEENAVRQLVVGQLVITLTNENTGASLTTQLGGAFHTYFNADGTLTIVGTGNSFLALFPTDVRLGRARRFSRVVSCSTSIRKRVSSRCEMRLETK
jgi:hypothetical protein